MYVFSLVQTLFVIGSRVKQKVIFFGTGRACVAGRTEEHATPSREVDEGDGESADDHHEAHQRNACLRRESGA